MKRCRCMMVLLVLAAALLTAGAAADSAQVIGTGDWLAEPVLCARLDGADGGEYNALCITGYRGADACVEVPDSLTFTPEGAAQKITLPVVGLGAEAFAGNNTLTGVTLGDHIFSIDAGAFSRCTSLVQVRLGGGVTGLGEDVFFGCTALREVVLSEGLAGIGAGCFEDCMALTHIEIPQSVSHIGRDAFKNCTSLSEVSLPRRVSYVGGHAFLNTPWLEAQREDWIIVGDGVLLACRRDDEALTLPENVRMISSAFENHRALKEIRLCSGLEVIGEHAFSGCDALQSVQLPENVRIVGAYAFSDCTALGNVTIGRKVREIGEYSFSNCTALNALKLSEGLLELGEGAFFDCRALREVALGEGLAALKAHTFANCTALKEVLVPPSVGEVAEDAFENVKDVTLRAVYGSAGERYARANGLSCTFLRQNNGEYVYLRTERGIEIIEYIGSAAVLEMPDELDGASVVSIGAGAFEQALSLRSITLSAGIERVEDWAFAGLYRLEQVMLGGKVTHLGADAFSGCTALREIYLPAGLTALNERTFEDCGRLRVLADADSVIFSLAQEAGFETVDILTEYDAFRYEKRGDVLALCGCGTDERTLSLPTHYAGRAVTAVGGGAFEGGEWTIEVPAGYAALEDGAFRSCTRLDITLPESLTHMAEDALVNCENVTLRGYVGSAAEEYARRTGCRFIVRHDR